jgi:uncharacterized membrane protein
MEKVFILAIVVTCLFVFLKTLEMKYIDKQLKPMKYLLRDAFMVFVCGFTGSFLIFNMNLSITDFFNVVTESKSLNASATQIFTDEPGF